MLFNWCGTACLRKGKEFISDIIFGKGFSQAVDCCLQSSTDLTVDIESLGEYRHIVFVDEWVGGRGRKSELWDRLETQFCWTWIKSEAARGDQYRQKVGRDKCGEWADELARAGRGSTLTCKLSSQPVAHTILSFPLALWLCPPSSTPIPRPAWCYWNTLDW